MTHPLRRPHYPHTAAQRSSEAQGGSHGRQAGPGLEPRQRHSGLTHKTLRAGEERGQTGPGWRGWGRTGAGQAEQGGSFSFS